MTIKELVRKYQGTPQFEKIIEGLSKDFFSIYSDEIYNSCEVEDIICDIESIDEEADVDYACGATKVVIIFNDIVFKTSFAGYMEYDDGFDDDDEEKDDYDDLKTIYYNTEDDKSYDYAPDYCQLEALVYAEAVLDGLDDFFAGVVRVSKRVFAQLRADRTLCGLFNDLEEDFGLTESEVEEIREEYGFDERVPAYAIGYWFVNKESDRLQKFANFLYNHNINDLHSSNIGFFDGEIKLFDYSGYNSGAEYTF